MERQADDDCFDTVFFGIFDEFAVVVIDFNVFPGLFDGVPAIDGEQSPPGFEGGLGRVVAMKNAMQAAPQAEAALARQSSAIVADSLRSGFGGGGGRAAGPGAAPARPVASMPASSASRGGFLALADASEVGDSAQPFERVQQVANQTFYYRNSQWEDPSVTVEQRNAAIVVKQFSDEYFELVAKHGRELTQFLTTDEPVLLNFKGQTYLFSM